MIKNTNPHAEIFSQGEEITTGQIADTNAAWLSQELVKMGFDVARHTAVGDRIDALSGLLKEIAGRADCCICSGGLGPTIDDLTAQAVSEAFGLPLREDGEALRNIQNYFSQRGRTMPEINCKQALLPGGATRLDNDWGTAPGFTLQAGRCWFAFVPGVPLEMKNLFAHRIKDILLDLFPLQPCTLVTLRSVGIGESSIQEKLHPLFLPDGVVLSFRAGTQDVETKLLFPSRFPAVERRQIVENAAKAIGRSVYHINDSRSVQGDLVSVIGDALLERGQSMAAIETLSGGHIASRCGAGEWFFESRVVREVGRLLKQLQLPVEDYSNAGSMRHAAEQAARLLRNDAGVDFALVQLWNGERDRLFREDHVVHLYTALATPDGVFSGVYQAGGNAARKQSTAATVALDTLRRHLTLYPHNAG